MDQLQKSKTNPKLKKLQNFRREEVRNEGYSAFQELHVCFYSKNFNNQQSQYISNYIDQILVMYSEYSRYNKTNTHIRIQDQKNHYQQIVNPRNTMRINTNDETRYMSLNHHNKHTHEIQRQRKKDNKILNTRLISILKGKGLLTKVEEKAKKLKNRKNLTLLSDFKRKEEKNDIISDNKMLVEKIQKVRPYIGNKKEWKIHEEQFKTMERRLCNKTIQQPLNPHKLLRQTLNSSNRQNQYSSKVTPTLKLEENETDNEVSLRKKMKKNPKSILRNEILHKSLENQEANDFETSDK